MIKSYANKITSFLYSNSYIDNDKYKYDVYLYGFEILIASLVNMISVLIIGLLFNKFIYAVIFLVCYCPIRQFSGGYHAESYRKCYFTFMIIFLSTIFIVNNVSTIDLRLAIILFVILNWININILAPINHPNNPLTETENSKYRKNCRIISTIVIIFSILSSQFKITYECSIYSSLALFWINTMMVLAVIKNRSETI